MGECEVIFRTEGVIGRRIILTDESEVVALQLENEYEIAEHQLPFDITFYINSGSGELIIEGKSYFLFEGMKIDIAKDLKRGWKNNSAETLYFTGIKKLK